MNISKKTIADFNKHALDEYPRECCGLVAIIKGKQHYLPCRNIAEGHNENFVLNPEDYAKAEDLGEIVAVAHSHPDAQPRPSEADRVMCNASGLPWLIVGVIKEGDELTLTEVNRIEPDGYEAPLVGRTFVHGVLDCYSLIKDYYKRELGIELPHFERRDDWWNKGDDLYMQHFEEAGFLPFKGPIQLHDVIIMQVRSPVPNHAAVYIGNDQILHHMYGRLSTREVYGGSHYQEVTRLVVRHTELMK